MLFWTLSGLTLLLTVLTFLPLWRYEARWVRGGDFPRLQFAIAALILLAIAALVLDLSRPGSWVVIAASLVSLLYQSWWILPFTPLYPKEVKAAAHADRDNMLRIMVANVMTPNRNASALLAIVEANRPDVLVAVETDAWWQAQLDVLERDYPHALKCPQDNLYGMHLYSRLRLTTSRVREHPPRSEKSREIDPSLYRGFERDLHLGVGATRDGNVQRDLSARIFEKGDGQMHRELRGVLALYPA